MSIDRRTDLKGRVMSMRLAEADAARLRLFLAEFDSNALSLRWEMSARTIERAAAGCRIAPASTERILAGMIKLIRERRGA